MNRIHTHDDDEHINKLVDKLLAVITELIDANADDEVKDILSDALTALTDGDEPKPATYSLN